MGVASVVTWGVGVALVVTCGKGGVGVATVNGGAPYRSDVDIDVLVRNVRVIAEALARHMYNLSIFVSHWM